MLIPARPWIITYSDWLQHYKSGVCQWFYDYQVCRKRDYLNMSNLIADKSVAQTWVISIDDVPGQTDLTPASYVRLKDAESWFSDRQLMFREVKVPQVKWLQAMLNAMAQRLAKHGIAYTKDYHLISSCEQTIEPESQASQHIQKTQFCS